MIALLLAALTAAALPLSVQVTGAAVERAVELAENGRWEEARDLLRAHVAGHPEDGRAHLLLGQALLALEARDEAAHHLERAALRLDEGGDTRRAKLARRDLQKADPLAGRRARVLRDTASKLRRAAEQLFENGHPERALELLDRLGPIARGEEAEELEALRARVAAATTEIDLDSATRERTAEGHWPLVVLEGEHYRLEANLEPELVQLVADTMDDIHGYYVEIYLDGDEKAAPRELTTIRIHPTRESMLEGWNGGSAPEGWWSPGENRVTCYDTRTTTGGLDWMLETLFHESSHQFMTILCRRGGWSPAWLNEGTATFFEGATAMADHRVLWPDAAIGRLTGVSAALESDRGPSLHEVIGYSGGGSYPGGYYPFGWGLVYFLLQYEDPTTLEYVYRPLYARYRDEITRRGGSSMELFEEVFLGEGSPLGHESLHDFEATWRPWILERIEPLHLAPKPERRRLRLELVERYLAAARDAAGNRKAPVAQEDLLLRALGHVEYVRTRIDGDEHPDVSLIERQAAILEELGRPGSAAPLVQELLDLADEEVWTPGEEAYAELERRLRRLDRRNWALRNARSAIHLLARSARSLLEDYTAKDEAMPLRAYTFAALAGAALGDQEVLLPAARELRARARELGRLRGEVHPLAAPPSAWTTIFSAEPRSFRSTGGDLLLESVRPYGCLNTRVEVGEEYEVRGTFRRTGDQHLGTCHGLVVAGVKEGDWLVFGLLPEGEAGLWRLRLGSGGGVTTKRIEHFSLDPAPADDVNLAVRVHVTDGRDVEVRVGECTPIRTSLPEDLPAGRYAGVYVKDGITRLESPVVEVFP